MKMKLKILTTLLFVNLAQAECVLQSNTMSQANIQIQERSGFSQNIIRMPNGTQRCQVAFRAKIKNEWHTALGHYDIEPGADTTKICTMAQQLAETGLVSRLATKNVASDAVLTCRDQPDLATLRDTQVGTVGQIHQFRPHPNYPRRFTHNGTQCQMFVDPVLSARDVKIWQGVICNLQDSKWVVVDKF
jgi:hypothetical protein